VRLAYNNLSAHLFYEVTCGGGAIYAPLTLAEVIIFSYFRRTYNFSFLIFLILHKNIKPSVNNSVKYELHLGVYTLSAADSRETFQLSKTQKCFKVSTFYLVTSIENINGSTTQATFANVA